jgi:hypothetical protein
VIDALDLVAVTMPLDAQEVAAVGAAGFGISAARQR